MWLLIPARMIAPIQGKTKELLRFCRLAAHASGASAHGFSCVGGCGNAPFLAKVTSVPVNVTNIGTRAEGSRPVIIRECSMIRGGEAGLDRTNTSREVYAGNGYAGQEGKKALREAGYRDRLQRKATRAPQRN